MAANSVNIENSTVGLGDTMSEIRTWLDTHKIQPIEFKTSPGDNSTVNIMIRFETPAQALMFERNFTKAVSR